MGAKPNLYRTNIYENHCCNNKGIIILIFIIIIGMVMMLGPSIGEAAPTPKEPLPQGDAAIGRDLYVGAVSFRNGGGSCLACHDAGGIGVLGGGVLGPDLTKVYNTYGETALGSVLAAPTSPFPTMKPIYDTQPLTKEEVANLIAFFAATAAEPSSSQRGTRFAMYGLGGTLILLTFSGLFWKGRLQNVRRSLIEQATQKANQQQIK